MISSKGEGMMGKQPMNKNQGYDAEQYAALAGFSGDWRDSWWHQDYLELLAKRWGASDVKSVLDVGCGAGHWGQRIASLLDDPIVTGVDHEPGFLDAARTRATGRPGTYAYLRGTAEGLPFDDDTFDMVTCQTVLIHVADAEVALREMIRVAKPGGLIVAAEPNNRTNRIVNAACFPRPDLEETLQLMRFDDACIRGKMALGQGDAEVGEKLPHLFASMGLTRMHVSTNDRNAWLVPPYSTATEQQHIALFREHVAAKICRWGDYERAKQLYLAGGGTEDAFEVLYALDVRRHAQVLADIDAGRHVWGGGFVMYVASGRKPS